MLRTRGARLATKASTAAASPAEARSITLRVRRQTGPVDLVVRAANKEKDDEHWSAQLNVENMFDTEYWISSHNNNNISYGAPTSAFVTMKAKW